jgi:sigma-E factor negative regulatory protein RseB
VRIPAVAVIVLLLALLVGAPVSFADSAGQDELKWLETMAFAAHQANYSGTFVYQYGSHVETSRITHVVDDQGEHGRLESLDGARREIIRNNDQVQCYYGDHSAQPESHQGGREFPALLPEQLALLEENYLIKPAEEGRVADYQARVTLIQPKDNLRYAYKVWAHKDAGLLLKAEVLDERGAVVERYAFTQLNIGGNIDRSWIIPDAPRKSAAPANLHHAHTEQQPPELPHIARHLAVGAEASPVNSGWRVDALPAGFKKIVEVSRRIQGKDGPVIQLVFSDGLAGVSIFIEKSDSDEDDFAGLFSQGIVQVYSKPLDGQLVTVVGEVPPQTVMQIADSVRYAGQ